MLSVYAAAPRWRDAWLAHLIQNTKSKRCSFTLYLGGWLAAMSKNKMSVQLLKETHDRDSNSPAWWSPSPSKTSSFHLFCRESRPSTGQRKWGEAGQGPFIGRHPAGAEVWPEALCCRCPALRPSCLPESLAPGTPARSCRWSAPALRFPASVCFQPRRMPTPPRSSPWRPVPQRAEGGGGGGRTGSVLVRTEGSRAEWDRKRRQQTAFVTGA